jgi:hypothetical protein
VELTIEEIAKEAGVRANKSGVIEFFFSATDKNVYLQVRIFLTQSILIQRAFILQKIKGQRG